VDIIPFLFFITLFFNIRASIKLALDWRGMLVTTRFVRDAYARLAELQFGAGGAMPEERASETLVG